MRIVVLDAFTLDQGDTGIWDPLRRFGELTVHARTAQADSAARCRGASAVFTNKVALDAGSMGPDLRYIGILATGTDLVDLEAAKSRGIAVANVPGYSTDSVAQLVFAMLLHFTHDAAGHGADVAAGKWAAAPDFSFMRKPLTELSGKTLAVVGSGAIGSAVARIAQAFGMDTIAVQVPGSRTQERIPLSEALPRADAVTLHCPLTDRTRGLVDAAFLADMKPGAILINTGRGPLLDEAAVRAALDAGRLGGLGLDVLSREPPPPGHPLLDPGAPWAGKVLVTPHIGWATVEARRRLVQGVLANFAAFLEGRDLNRVA